jgi:type I restriction enzyme S subunit
MPKYRFDQIAINSTKKKKPVEEDKYTYIGLEHLDSGTLEVTRWGSEVAPIGEKLLMQKGDVLFGKRRAYQKKVAIAPFDGIFSAHGMILRPHEEVVNKDYFPMFISSDYFLDEAIRISVGSLSPTINWKDLAKLEFYLPPLDEQEKAAKVLWAIEETCQSYKKLLAETDELIKSQFIEMFGENRRVRLGDYIQQIRGVSYKPVDLSTELDSEHITLLRANNVNGGNVNFDDVQFVDRNKVSQKQIICKDDILMCASSGSLEHVGKAALCTFHGEYTFGAFCKLIRVIKEIKAEYIAAYFQSDEYRRIISDLAQGVFGKMKVSQKVSKKLAPQMA